MLLTPFTPSKGEGSKDPIYVQTQRLDIPTIIQGAGNEFLNWGLEAKPYKKGL